MRNWCLPNCLYHLNISTLLKVISCAVVRVAVARRAQLLLDWLLRCADSLHALTERLYQTLLGEGIGR